MVTLERAPVREKQQALARTPLDDTLLAGSTCNREIEELFVRHYRSVCAIVNRRVQNYADAEDIAQSVFCKLALNLPMVQGCDVARWLARVAVNASIDALRQKRLAWLPLVEGQSQEISAELTYLQEAEVSRVRSAMDLLPAQLRLVVQLSHFDGLTQQQIARRTGTPLGTVKTRIRRGLELLRRTLHQSEYSFAAKR